MILADDTGENGVGIGRMKGVRIILRSRAYRAAIICAIGANTVKYIGIAFDPSIAKRLAIPVVNWFMMKERWHKCA